LKLTSERKSEERETKNAPDLKSTHNHRTKMGMKPMNESKKNITIKTKRDLYITTEVTVLPPSKFLIKTK
jgi:hypothetical protein